MTPKIVAVWLPTMGAALRFRMDVTAVTVTIKNESSEKTCTWSVSRLQPGAGLETSFYCERNASEYSCSFLGTW